MYEGSECRTAVRMPNGRMPNVRTSYVQHDLLVHLLPSFDAPPAVIVRAARCCCLFQDVGELNSQLHVIINCVVENVLIINMCATCCMRKSNVHEANIVMCPRNLQDGSFAQ